MKKHFYLLLFLLIFLIPISAIADDILYYGNVTKNMTIRKTRSTSGTKVGSVAEGEQINILEYGETWTKVTKDGVTGFVLTKNVKDLSKPGAGSDEDNCFYLGTAAKHLTVRAKRSKSALQMQEIEEGEQIYINELGKEWIGIVKNGIEGFVVASGVKDIRAAREDIVVPEEYLPDPPFEANYTATADVNLTIRKKQDTGAAQVGTVYEKESVEVMSVDGDWAFIRKKGTEGYVLSSHLRYYRRTDPFGPYIPGVEFWAYAATATQDVDVYDVETNELIRTFHAGDTFAVSGLDEKMSVRMPYQRRYGRIVSTAYLSLEPAVAWDSAQPGDLISIFSTFYPETPNSAKEEGRLYNITEGVKRLDGVVVRAGEEFSFNEHCAPYTKGNGYVEGPIINYAGTKHTGYGGGICQVSTTLYDAVLQIPIEIVRQQVHSSYGIFYAPLDMDAAVGAANLDLKLRNVLPYDIQMKLETRDGVMCVRIYRYKES